VRGVVALVMAAVVALVPAVAGARRIAVLEFRSGATGVPGVGARLAKILSGKTSHEIQDPADARRKNPRVDEAIAKCGGEPACVARVGKELGADEVLLVGVSELGDLILAIQRVDAQGKVLGRVADALPPETNPDDAALEGYLKRLMPASDFLRYGTIRVESNVTGALVEIGGKPRGLTPIKPLRVEAPITLDVRVSKSGFGDFTARVEVPPDGTVAVHPVLGRLTSTAWYGRWWVWAIAGGVAVTAVAVGFALTDEGPSSVPVIVEF
jgi:hypothetical protein